MTSKIMAQVRAFAGWPGTSAQFVLDPFGLLPEEMTVKIITTRVRRKEGGACLGVHEVRKVTPIPSEVFM